MARDKEEWELLAALHKFIEPEIVGRDRGVIIKHADYATIGVPDFTVTAKTVGGTQWWEAKIAQAKVKMKGRGLQHLTMRRLAAAGEAWYVIWQTGSLTGRTCIVAPKEIMEDGTFTCPTERWAPGIDHRFILDFMKRARRPGER